MNNFEKIKQMSVDEMAKFFESKNFSCKICKEVMKERCSELCVINIKQWLLTECE